MKNIVLKNGLIGGLITTIIMGISAYFAYGKEENFSLSMIIGFTGIFLAHIFLFKGVKQYRDLINKGSITFGTAFKVGIFIALIISSIYVFVWLIEFKFFFPEFMNKFSEAQLNELNNSGLSTTEIAIKTKEIEATRINYNTNSLLVIAMTYMEILPIGIILSIIAAFVYKKKG